MTPPDEQRAFLELCGMLIQRYRADVAGGKVDAVRQKALEPLLSELTAVLHQPDADISALMQKVTQLRKLMERVLPLTETSSHGKPRPAPGSRGASLMDALARLKLFVGGEINRPLQGPRETATGRALLGRLAEAESALPDLANTAAQVLTFERDVLRQLALEVHEYALRHHVMLTEPVWACASVAGDPSGLFFSGSPDRQALVAGAARELGLNLRNTTVGRNVAQARWDDLRRSSVAVFDLDVDAGPALAATCYELGASSVLGTRCVMLASPGTILPFDIDVEPVMLSGERDDHRRLTGALDEGLYQANRLAGDSSAAATARYARERLLRPPVRDDVRLAFAELRDDALDPLDVWTVISHALGFVGPGNFMLTRPAWPGRYPEAGRRCFHVSPYRPSWAAEVAAAAEAACVSSGVDYVIGHRVDDPRVVRSIWDEICHATHVLVDLTDFNANVALELGLAHALGKQTLIIGQDGTVEHLFPALRKVRVHSYRTRDSAGLTTLVRDKLIRIDSR